MRVAVEARGSMLVCQIRDGFWAKLLAVVTRGRNDVATLMRIN
jgi:hypothetical protein